MTPLQRTLTYLEIVLSAAVVIAFIFAMAVLLSSCDAARLRSGERLNLQHDCEFQNKDITMRCTTTGAEVIENVDEAVSVNPAAGK